MLLPRHVSFFVYIQIQINFVMIYINIQILIVSFYCIYIKGKYRYIVLCRVKRFQVPTTSTLIIFDMLTID